MECPEEHVVADFVQGRLPEAQREHIETHVDRCAACYEVVSQLLRLYPSTIEPPSSLPTEGGDGGQVADEGAGLTPGSTVGRYHVLGFVGAGGMGMVYAAFDPELDRKVALKLLRGERSRADSSEKRDSLLLEAKAMARVSHANVVPVHNVGTVDGRVFLAMEFVEGANLSGWLRREQRAWEEVLSVFRAAGQGLAAVHAAGLVHRDFKPDNVLIGDDGRARVTDFGLSRAVHGRARESRDGQPRSEIYEMQLTSTGVVIGTPAYMAPEQHAGDAIDAQSDQFSFCVALHEGLYGKRPFVGDTLPVLQGNVLGGRVRRAPPNSDVPLWLRRIVLRGLEVDPAKRWPSMEDLLGQLARDPRATRRRLVAAGAVVALSGLAVVAARGLMSDAVRGCARSADQVDEIWGKGQQTRVREAIHGTKAPHAADTWLRVERQLAAYSRDWVEAYAVACDDARAERQPGEVLDLRMACLQERRARADAVIDILSETDRDVMNHAIDATANLPPIALCGEADALASRVKPPADAETADAVAQLRAGLARAEALSKAGKYQTGVAVAEDIADAAAELEYPPVLAEALYWLGMLQRSTASFEAAEDSLARAGFMATGSGHDKVAADAFTDLVAVVLNQGKPQEAQSWAKHARAAVDRLGPGGLEEANLLQNVGVLHRNTGDYEAAHDHHVRALEIRKRVFGADHPRVAQSLNSLGVVANGRRRYAEAQRYYEDALAAFQSALGDEHPTVAGSLYNVSLVLGARGELDAAADHLRRSALMRERTLRRGHPDLAASLNALGSLLERQGKLEPAKAHFQRALAIWEIALGPSHPRVAISETNLANLMMAQGHADEAERRLERSLAIFSETFGPRHVDVATALYALGGLSERRGQHELASRYYERSVLTFDEVVRGDEPSPRFRADAQFGLARALWRRGQPGRARDLARVSHDGYVAAGNDPQAQATAKWLAER